MRVGFFILTVFLLNYNGKRWFMPRVEMKGLK